MISTKELLPPLLLPCMLLLSADFSNWRKTNDTVGKPRECTLNAIIGDTISSHLASARRCSRFRLCRAAASGSPSFGAHFKAKPTYLQWSKVHLQCVFCKPVNMTNCVAPGLLLLGNKCTNSNKKCLLKLIRLQNIFVVKFRGWPVQGPWIQ